MFAGLGSDPDAAIEAARAGAGTALVAVAGQREPTFTTLVVAADRAAVERVADLGLYAVTVRRMRHQRRVWPIGEPTPGVTSVHPLVHHPALTAAAADEHWRDVHAPLALRHHPGMWHYHQISVDDVLDGPVYDGVALCAFASEQEMTERFFGDDEDRRIIAADVASFADVDRSPRRVRMTEWRFAPDD